METANNASWGWQVFGDAELGDTRLKRRLIQLAGVFTKHAGESVSGSFEGNKAGEVAAYRFLDNDRVDAADIAEAGFSNTARCAAKSKGIIVAAEDTTTLSFAHDVEGFGDLGGPAGSTKTGLFVHSTLLLCFDSGSPIGLIQQQRWSRDSSTRGKRHERHSRPYEEKESKKWERGSRSMAERLPVSVLSRVVSVCDREADIWEYLSYKTSTGQRFVVRATRTRQLVADKKKLADAIVSMPELGRVEIEVQQRGGKHGRSGRKANLVVKAGTVEVLAPTRKANEPPIEISVVQATEVDAPVNASPMSWTLLTTEPVAELADAAQVLDLYRLRWRIEDFHKAWKTGGTNIEGSRLQEAANIERLSVILSFIAVRILQLRDIKEHYPKACVTEVFTNLEWKVLWAYTEKKRPPKKPPSLEWGYTKIAQLGAWSDTKRTGRAGWVALWRGWMKLERLVEGYNLAKQFGNLNL